MKLRKLISLIVTILISVLLILPAKAESPSSPLSASGDFVWARSTGGSANRGYGIATDSSGNVYTTGVFNSSLDFDGDGVAELIKVYPGPDQIFISKLNNNGEFIWAKEIGRGGTDTGYSVTIDSSGNVYVTGYFSAYNNGSGVIVDFDPGDNTYNLTNAGGEDIFILKLDINGNFVWAKGMGGTGNDRGYDIVVDSNSNVYTTGYFSDTVDFDPGSGAFSLTSAGMSDIFVSKLNSAGDFVWAKRMGGASTPLTAGFDAGYGIAADSNGNIYTTGLFDPEADFDPGIGVFSLTNNGGSDAFISKLDSNGNFVWAKGISGTSIDAGYDITLDTINNIYTTGYFWGNVDFDPGIGVFNLGGNGNIFVSKLDSNGDFIWAKGLGSEGTGYGRGITVDVNGNVYTAGDFTGSMVDFDPGPDTAYLTNIDFYSSIFISKLDNNGNFVWAKGISGTYNDMAEDLALDINGNIFTTGFFSGIADFDPGAGTNNLTSMGIDAFISKLEGDPIVLSSVVTNTNNSGSGSLRQAIQDTSSGGTITFDPSLAGQTIHLASELEVNKSITIDGSNLTPPITVSGDTDNDGDGDVQLMTIASFADVTINSIDFTKGYPITQLKSGGINNLGSLTIIESSFSENKGGQGGAILNSGNLTIDHVDFTANSAPDGGAILNDLNATAIITSSTFTQNSTTYGNGGAIGNIGNLTVNDCQFTQNTAGEGGGISNLGTMTTANSTLSSNSADFGGGVANFGILTVTKSNLSLNSGSIGGGGIMNFHTGILTVEDSFISNNSADNGGGIFNFNTATITNSTISGNSVSTNGNGGGISTWFSLTLTNSTVVGNNAETGGGVFNLGTLTATNVTLSENAAVTGGGIYNGIVTPEMAGTFNYSNTIIANSTSGADCYNDGVINININNLVENNAALPNQCGTPVLIDDPKLGPLGNNGGVTQTMSLLTGSPAIDAGDDTVCAAELVNNSSQNGVTRPQGNHCDIGAFEYSTPFPDLIITNVTISPTVPLPNQTFEISITIKNQGGTGSANTVFRDVYINRDPSTLIDPATGCPSPGDFFRSDSYASLPAGMTDTKTITITGGLPSGNHQFWFYVDSRCLVDEGGGSNSVP